MPPLVARSWACSLACVALLGCLVSAPCSAMVLGHYAGHVGHLGHPLSKRSFFDIQCKGVYDKSIFARLDRICEDCYNLFREPQLHSLCRSDCYSTVYFKGCLEALLLKEEEAKFDLMIESLSGGLQ
ncbi:Ion transport peptide [Frankliniella occidentalis]|nr:ion transport peptide isoform X2 [Frankliniella occidentalis]XP_026283575.1 ion transport peptide isoform X2 [Frankliniella occidentalis]XP_026283576.1 ion transport peptide isoform X2 [Frankliniella occidentalis]XP_026283577.1 ion transport peptide isoform X2 [Frankliniella occidentalis]KAE8752092.1 Ion transport peptide [Frankliniella occidentalis]